MTQSQESPIFLSLLLLVALYGLVSGYTHSIEPRLAAHESSSNVSKVSQPTKLSRAKRVAIYNGQGIVKFVAGVAHPVKLADKDQSFWFFYNLQNQYIPTTIPIYWWSFWNTTTFVSTARQLRKDMQQTLHRDETRMWFYNSIEAGMELLQGSELGATCLLRSICEVSQLPFENSNVFSEVLNSVLVPTADNVPQKYLDARDAGRGGADCKRTYRDCNQKSWKWLTSITRISV